MPWAELSFTVSDANSAIGSVRGSVGRDLASEGEGTSCGNPPSHFFDRVLKLLKIFSVLLPELVVVEGGFRGSISCVMPATIDIRDQPSCNVSRKREP